jgi:DNA-binding transcriptional LysR family regulator
MYPGIELRLYRYVSVLAEELNFTQAALRLHVSQPTLSTQIRDLEREIRAKLFERTRGGQQVVLTASGEAFAAEARLALVHAARFVSEVLEIRGYDAEADQYSLHPIYIRRPDLCATGVA